MGISNIVFVGGIHGVGKTTLCNEISKHLGIESYSSSSLISNFNSEKVRRDKKVEDIEQNQNILIKAVETYLTDSEKKYLLDGHFCLINKSGHIEEVPIETFKELKLRGIIIVIDSPEGIVERLEIRDGKKYSLEFIEIFQEREISYGKSVANQLGIKYAILNQEKKEQLYIKNIEDML